MSEAIKKQEAQKRSVPRFTAKNSGGIVLRSGMQFSSKKANAPHGFDLPYKLLLVLLGVFGCGYSFISYFDLPRSDVLFCAATLGFIGIFCLVFYFKRAVKFALPAVLLLFGIMVWMYFDEIRDGFLAALNAAAPIVNKMCGYEMLASGYLIEGTAQEQELMITLALLSAMFILSGVVTFSVIYKQRFFVGFMATLPIGFVGLLLGLVPSYPAVFALATFWIAMIVSSAAFDVNPPDHADFVGEKGNTARYMANRAKFPLGHSQLIVIVIAVLCFVGNTLFLSATHYTRSNGINVLYDKLAGGVSNMTSEDIYDIFVPPVSDDLLLGKKDSQIYRGVTAIRVKSRGLKNPVYLRGYTGSIYTGEGWTNNTKDMDTAAMMLAFEQEGKLVQNLQSDYMKTVAMAADVIEVSNVTSKNYIYAPYNAIFPVHSAITYHGDGFVTVKGTDDYAMSFFDLPYPIDTKGGRNSNRLEPSYAKFAKSMYTALPDGKFGEIKAKYSALADKNTDIAALIAEIRRELDERAEYTLSPGATPKGEDLVEHFLYENKKGYCVYFASAAVIMLRAAGVPTRYADGYVIYPEDFADGDTADIPDNRGHAWAEMYVDGYGWTPVDVTPGNGDSLPPALTTTAPTESVTTVSETLTQETTTTPPATTVYFGEEVHSKEISRRYKDMQVFFIWLAVIAAVLTALSLRRSFVCKKRAKSFSTPNRNDNIRAMYDYYKKLFALAHLPTGEERFEVLTALLNEVTFSNHIISQRKQQEFEIFVTIYACITFELQSYPMKLIMMYVFNLY